MKDESSVLILKRFRPDHPLRDETTVFSVVMSALDTRDGRPMPPSNSDELSPGVMLRLITYCYAKGKYASAEIARKLRKSPVHQDLPEATDIRRFRRCNRMALQNALEKTLQAFRRGEVGEETIIELRRAASEKLETAAIVDMSLDE